MRKLHIGHSHPAALSQLIFDDNLQAILSPSCLSPIDLLTISLPSCNNLVTYALSILSQSHCSNFASFASSRLLAKIIKKCIEYFSYISSRPSDSVLSPLSTVRTGGGEGWVVGVMIVSGWEGGGGGGRRGVGVPSLGGGG